MCCVELIGRQHVIERTDRHLTERAVEQPRCNCVPAALRRHDLADPVGGSSGHHRLDEESRRTGGRPHPTHPQAHLPRRAGYPGLGERAGGIGQQCARGLRGEVDFRHRYPGPVGRPAGTIDVDLAGSGQVHGRDRAGCAVHRIVDVERHPGGVASREFVVHVGDVPAVGRPVSVLAVGDGRHHEFGERRRRPPGAWSASR